MRQLDLNTAKKAVRLLKKSGSVDKIKALLTASGGELSDANAFALFADIITGICGEELDGELDGLLGYVLEIPPAEVGTMALDELFKRLGEFKAANPNISDFFASCFTSASRA